METRKRKKARISQSDCVACGCCVKVCPRQALSVERGLFAQVKREHCIGCGKCVRECPAGIIRLEEAEA